MHDARAVECRSSRARGDQPRTIGSNQASLLRSFNEGTTYVNMSLHRNPFGDADNQTAPRRRRPRADGIGRERWRDINHRGVGPGRVRPPRATESKMGTVFSNWVPALAGRDTGHQIGPVRLHLRSRGRYRRWPVMPCTTRRVLRSIEHAHGSDSFRSCQAASAMAFFTASSMVLGRRHGRTRAQDLAALPRRSCPRGALRPARRSSSALCASMIPWAMTSTRAMPPKMLIRIAFTLGSCSDDPEARSTTRSGSFTVPMSRKLAGLAARELDRVHRRHREAGAVDDAADVAVELDVVGMPSSWARTSSGSSSSMSRSAAMSAWR